MAVGDAYAFPCFLQSVLTQLSFQSNRLLFSHASPEVRGENTAGKKVRLNRVSNSQPPGHESDTLSTEPAGRGALILTLNILNNVNEMFNFKVAISKLIWLAEYLFIFQHRE